MSGISGDDGIIRPIPRRPFDLNISSPSPPDEDSAPPSPTLNDARLLDPRAEQGVSISRAQSIMNLTASTLFGIYGPASGGRGGFGGYATDRDEPGTPWGTGAESPAQRPDADGPAYEPRRRAGQTLAPPAPPPSRAILLASLAARAALLFALGTGYGALVSRLQDEPSLAALQMEGIVNPGQDWRCLAFWGVSGVVLGTLLPWFDGVLDRPAESKEEAAKATSQDATSDTDWALVIRSIGAFAGIVFAIRKLAWASTMQVSMTLALVNPFLWYLIDRSMSGFLLSAAVGLTGSAILMGLNPGMMPAPAHTVGSSRNGSIGAAAQPLVLGGFARQETVETGIWMLSVLFCSCVCFGNIGRRLALGRPARGRWGGLR